MQSTILTPCRHTASFKPGTLTVITLLAWLFLTLTVTTCLTERVVYAERGAPSGRSVKTVSDLRSENPRPIAAEFMPDDIDLDYVSTRDLFMLLEKEEHDSNGDDVIVRIER